MKIVRFCSKKEFLSSVPSLNLLKSHSNHCPDSGGDVLLRIMNCVTMKLIRLQAMQGQLQLGGVGVFYLLKPQGLRKYKSV